MDTLQLLSQSLRGAIIAPPGKLLFVADFANIESRVLLWCAKDDAGLEMYRKGVDMYCDMATTIYGYPVVADKKNQPPERRLGKEVILAAGFQMGWQKFKQRCEIMGILIDDDMAQRTIGAFRDKYWRVRELWTEMETAAGEAAYGKEGETHECGPTKWWRDGRFLYCQLPSGRRLAYPDPKIKMVTTSWGARKNALTFMGVMPMSRKWMRQTSYGGILVQNCVQAIARDCLAEAIVRLERSNVYQPVLTVHDEVLAEANEHLGRLEVFEQIVADVPVWAKGLPIGVEGFATRRYTKG